MPSPALQQLAKMALRQGQGAAGTAATESLSQRLIEASRSETFPQMLRCFAFQTPAKQAASSVAQQASGPSSTTNRALPALRRLFTTASSSSSSSASTAASIPTSAAAAAASAAASAARHAAPAYESLCAGLSDSARRQLTWWVGGCSAWVFSMVVIGGLTRLTRSGLSMTDWKFSGERPPLTQGDWEAEFTRYKASPEFRLLHSTMTLEEFKFIFWMEYGHRMWGRALGLAFVLPGSYFLARGYIRGALGKRLALLGLMGGAQGLVGWWMVRSGLKEPEGQQQVPRVSPYRLAAHLTSAFAIYAGLAWTTLSLAQPEPLLASASEAAQAAARKLRGRVLPLSLLVGITAVSGAFVAGLDAGRAFNTFPLMAGRLIPEEYWAMTGWRNAFENTAAVQLHHRALATSMLAAVATIWATSRALPLPPRVSLLMGGVAAVTAAQVTLGITTLLNYVPASLGASHQAGALVLFTTVLALAHSLRPAVPSRTVMMVARAVPPVAAVATLGVAAAVTLNY